MWLGRAVKELRLQAGLTTNRVAAHVGKNGSSISRMENAEVAIPEAVLEGYIELSGLTDDRRISELRTIRRDAAAGGWWDGYRKEIAPSLTNRAWVESKAVHIRSFEPIVLPGLLQLPEYAATLMRKRHPGASGGRVERWVEVRMQRQHIVSRHNPIALDCVVDESVLRRSPGGVDVMKQQLDFLVEVAERSNVTIRVLPSTAMTGVEGAFELFRLVEPYPDIGYVATPVGDVSVEGKDLERLKDGYAALQQASLDPTASRNALIAERDKF